MGGEILDRVAKQLGIGECEEADVSLPQALTDAVEPDSDTTDVVADAYDHDPAIEPATVGATSENAESP